ncbi:MAG TPA: methylated-DNA--[protein]-cysteine S-methyltransferase [Candidatus Saccharimonadales bacterium]|nr:methylated-DNA--[protein]-cysteine S-methyltransferase [Candidatus Saccharimonadales bacterium]
MIARAIESNEGIFTALFSNHGLAGLSFPGNFPTEPADGFVDPKTLGWIKLTQTAVQKVLQGEPLGELPPLDLSRGTEFQRRVWKAMRGIQMGQTLSYGQLAAQIGAPKAVRAVGGACGANPIPLLIPCHRVLAQNRRLGGFSGGLAWKKLLLNRERVVWLPPLRTNSKPLAA